MPATNPKLPTAHPTKWTLLIVTSKRIQLVYDYDTQAEAEAALAKAHERGERAFVQPPRIAWRVSSANRPRSLPARPIHVALTRWKYRWRNIFVSK